MSKPALFCLMGPTGIGKTEYALNMVRSSSEPMEIISADSMMVYKDLDIGTAKPSVAQRQEIKHHLLDICEPTHPYSAARFRSDAIELIQSMLAKGVTPLVVGGSMLYFYVLRYGIAPLPEADAALRAALNEEAERYGWEALHKRLMDCDPETATSLHPHHNTRIVRALEVYELTGLPLSSLRKRSLPGLESAGINAEYRMLLAEPLVARSASVDKPRSSNRAKQSSAHLVYEQRLRSRIEHMLESGLIDECRAALVAARLDGADDYARARNIPAFRAVGYGQIVDYLWSYLPEQVLTDKILSATRALVRRQLNWLRRFSDVEQHIHGVDTAS